MTPPFLGSVWTADGPLLVRALGRTSPMVHRRATRLVVDDYGNAVAYQRRCPDCMEWLPLSFDYFNPRGDGRETLAMQWRCKACTIVDRRARYRDPVVRMRYCERARINYRVRQELVTGKHMDTMRAVRASVGGPGSDPPGGYLPCAPLVPRIAAILAEESHITSGVEHNNQAVERLGLDTRTWYEWKHGRRKLASLAVLDRVLVALGLNPWDVWPPSDEPLEAAQHAKAARMWGFSEMSCQR